MSSLQSLANLTYNPFSGTFNNGKIQIFGASGTFTVPAGVTSVRARVWGGGGQAGGGFAMKVITGLTPAATVAVTVGAGATSSFGAYVSATAGGTAFTSVGGTGSGGDVNYSGGDAGGSVGGGGGGVASLFGKGGNGTGTLAGGYGYSGASGGGGGGQSGGGGNGITGMGSYLTATLVFIPSPTPISSIDFIGTGGGGVVSIPGWNGGGSSVNAQNGSFPGGGGSGTGIYSSGLCIVEW